MAKINYYDHDDEDIKNAIKTILKSGLSSPEKYSLLKNLVKEAPVDNNIYNKIIKILRESIFSRKDKNGKFIFAGLLEKPHQMALYVILMTMEIATLRHLKKDYHNVLEGYKKNAKYYTGLTPQQIDQNVNQQLSGEIGTEIDRKLDMQTSAQQKANARQQATAPNGLPTSAQKTSTPINPLNINDLDKKISQLSKEFSEKFNKAFQVYIKEGLTPLKKLAEHERLRSLGITEDDLNKVIDYINSGINQNSFISLLAELKDEIKTLEKRVSAVEKALNKSKSTMDFILETAFAFVFTGGLVGALGAIGSTAIKKMLPKTVVSLQFQNDNLVPKTVVTDFWTTARGKVLDDAVKDGIKQLARTVGTYNNVTGLFKKDINSILKSGTPIHTAFPIISFMAVQQEEIADFIIVLAYLGMFTRGELKMIEDYFLHRTDAVKKLETKRMFIRMMLKEEQQAIALNSLGYGFEVRNIDNVSIVGGPFVGLTKERYSEIAAIMSMDDYLYHNIDEILGDNIVPDPDAFQEDERRFGKTFSHHFRTIKVKIYKISDFNIYGIFLEVNAYKSTSRTNYNKEFGNIYFLSFLSPFIGDIKLAESPWLRPEKITISSVTPTRYFYKDYIEKLFKEHLEERMLWKKLLNAGLK